VSTRSGGLSVSVLSPLLTFLPPSSFRPGEEDCCASSTQSTLTRTYIRIFHETAGFASCGSRLDSIEVATEDARGSHSEGSQSILAFCCCRLPERVRAKVELVQHTGLWVSRLLCVSFSPSCLRGTGKGSAALTPSPPPCLTSRPPTFSRHLAEPLCSPSFSSLPACGGPPRAARRRTVAL
jgi:hypothetical protein